MTTTDGSSVQAVDGPVPSRHSAGRNRLVGTALIMLSVLAALTCYTSFTSWLPTDLASYREYKAAKPCPAHTEILRAQDCLRDIAFTVEGTHKTVRDLRLTLLGPPPFARTDVLFGNRNPVLGSLEDGDKLTGTVWRGIVVAVAVGDERQTSVDAPRDEPQIAVAVGTFAGLSAALCLMFGAVYLTRPRNTGHFTWRAYGKWLLIVTGASCAGVGLVTAWAGLPWAVVPTVCGVIAGGTAWFLYQDLRLGRVGREHE
ncbi:hypothetical protein [Streptomyces sp. NPDC007172]|uniref:hypothetical protein n=1 Tax=Streptomyces sp. NPDC007172 TaxID=3364776 RepID=UPI0036C2FE9C